MLCLANGRRMKIPNTFSFLFEMTEVNYISPATISRCAILYIEDNNTW
jgi:dynein heavy chain